MSDSGKASVASEATTSSKKSQNAPPNLRPLAPKPLPPPSTAQSLAIRTTTPTSVSVSRRRGPAPCAVCFRVGCQLPTHTAYNTLSRSSSGSSPEASSSSLPHLDPAFTLSYAYKLGQQYVDSNNSTTTPDPVYDLPLDDEMNTPEMHNLFHSWFVIQSQNIFRIPRPSELAGDLIWSPFFLPALQDPLLCLSVLAASAASLPRSTGRQTRNVMSLTLLGQAIQEMRERINSDPTHISDTTIAANVFLWLVNIFLEDTASMVSHASTIYALVESRGGIQNLGLVGALERLIRWVDICHSFVLPVACHYLDPPGTSAPLNPPPARYGTFWTLQGDISVSIDATVITVCHANCRLFEQLEQAESQGLSGAEYTRMLQRLLELQTNSSVLRARFHNQGQVDECILIALGLMQFYCFCGLETLRTAATTSLARLADAIKSTGGPSFWKKDVDLLIWLLTVVIMVPLNVNEKAWCLPFLYRCVATRFGLEVQGNASWRQRFKDCLQRFLWCDARLEQAFTNTCQLLEQEMKNQEDATTSDEDE